MSKTDVLKRLMDRVREIAESPENKWRQSLWQEEKHTARDHWRGKPKRDAEVIPFTLEPEIPMWSDILGFDIKEFYTEPIVYLENQLRMSIYRFENFKDCTVISTEVPIWFGTTFESSLFGADTIFSSNASPWIDRNPVFKEATGFGNLAYPDFYNDGLMPLAHRFYNDLQGMVDDDFTIIFPEWGRSPFGVAVHTRGYDNLLLDLVLSPDVAHELMRFITDSRKEWVRQRAEFLKQPIPKCNLYNDEVNAPTLSPHLAEEYVVPYEQDLSDFHGGISYWHSCGDNTKLLGSLSRIPCIEMLHVGPWTSIQAAKTAFGDNLPLEICLHPVRDLQGIGKEGMRARLSTIVQEASGSPFTIRADGLHVMTSLSEDLAKLQEWLQVARDLCTEANWVRE
jgi:hypothetical protein